MSDPAPAAPAASFITPKSLAAAFALVAAALGAGTYLGWTVEPAAMTECRVERVRAETLLVASSADVLECTQKLSDLVVALEAQ